jgi:hypothetical protein
LCNGKNDIINNLINDKDIPNFKDIDTTQIGSLKDYFKLFHFTINPDDTLFEGWLRQLHRSTGGQDNFLLNVELFTPQNGANINKYKWNKNLFKTEGICNDKKFADGFLSGDPFDILKKEFKKQNQTGAPGMTNKGEQLYKRIYDTLVSLYKF